MKNKLIYLLKCWLQRLGEPPIQSAKCSSVSSGVCFTAAAHDPQKWNYIRAQIASLKDSGCARVAIFAASDVFPGLQKLSGLKNYTEPGGDFLVEDASLKEGWVKIEWRYA